MKITRRSLFVALAGAAAAGGSLRGEPPASWGALWDGEVSGEALIGGGAATGVEEAAMRSIAYGPTLILRKVLDVELKQGESLVIEGFNPIRL